MRKKSCALLIVAISAAIGSPGVDTSGNSEVITGVSNFSDWPVGKPAGGPTSTEVTNTNDSGAGSLREAITNSNNSAGVDTISFAIPGAAPFTITLTSALPPITDPVIIDGTTQLGFAGSPVIELNGAGVGAGADGLTITAGASTVKSLVINRFTANGITLATNGGNTISGCYIGTDVTGMADLGNTENGINLNSPGNTIGGTAAPTGNVISGNNSNGIFINDNSTGTQVKGDIIGLDASETDWARRAATEKPMLEIMFLAATEAPSITLFDASHKVMPSHGVGIRSIAGFVFQNITIGGTAIGAGNVIAFNTANGVAVASGVSHVIRGNSIFSNGALGIDLNNDGMTANDSCDADTGANDLQNFPVLTSAASAGSSTTIQGALNSIASSTFTIDFYSTASCDDSGEGQAYLGSATVNTDGSCNAAINATLPIEVADGHVVTATATDSSGNTSEFSACLVVCGYSISPPSQGFPSGGGSNLVAVATSCAWTAVSNDAWITITSGSNGNGNGSVDYSVGVNPGAPRMGTMTIAGNTFTVIQGSNTPINLPVTSAANSGPGSLRDAITASNANFGQINTIQFPVSGDVTINLTSPLPPIDNPVVINGLTNGGRVTLDGTNAGTDANGLTVTGSGGSTISGLNINNFSGAGIRLEGNGGNTIQDVRIGTVGGGSNPTANTGDGIVIESRDNIIGGATQATANVITSNGGNGISIAGGTGNQIRINSIDSNGGLGIDLDQDGVTPNDTGDPDTGPNNLQNYPVLSAATSNGAGTSIQGTLNSSAGAEFIIDFYASNSADLTGFGEGQTYLGSTTVNTNGSGDAPFNVNFATPVTLGSVLTAIARNNASRNSSEFSQARMVAAPTAITLASFTATAYDNRVLIEWQTGQEADNLGFNIHRELQGNRTIVNSQLIAGSALKDGAALAAGESYAWWDSSTADCRSLGADCRNAVYWLEDIDLKGTSTWHGPFAVEHMASAPPSRSNAAELTTIGGTRSQAASRIVESTASMPITTRAQADAQAALASQPAVKIFVKGEGWYRVTQPELMAAGLNPNLDPRFLQMFVDGREIPIHVSAGKSGSFDSLASVEFYAIGMDTQATDARVYWLAPAATEGKRIPQTKSGGGSGPLQSFTQTVERRDRTLYFSALRNGDKENFFGAVVVGSGTDQIVNVDHLAQFDTSNFETTLEVALQGVTQTTHRVLVQLNGVGVREISFSGQQLTVGKFNIDHSLLQNGENIVRLIPQDGPGDISLVDHIRLSYQHTFDADYDALKLQASSGQLITINGFLSKAIKVFDVTDHDNVQELIGEISQSKTGFSTRVAPQQPGLRTLLALADGKVKHPASLEANKPSSWRNRANTANFVVITTADLSAAMNPFELARQAEGYKLTTVNVDDIYDEFNFGHKSPQAVKDFLSYAASNWKLAPQFLLLAGDASYDSRNYLGFGDADIIPTKLIDTRYMETASDDWLADFNGDGVADIAIGRLPVRDPDQASLVVTKLLSYRPSAEEALLVADENDGFNFEAATSGLRSLIPDSVRVTQVNRGRVDAETAKKALLAGINRKQIIVNYVGHGSLNQWRGNLLTSSDAVALRNTHLPVFVMMTCLNGYFHDAEFDSLAEALIKAQHGGAAAVWASSGMTFPDQQEAFNREFYRLLFARNDSAKRGASVSLGEAARRAKLAASDTDIRRTWVLLGDPTMRLR